MSVPKLKLIVVGISGATCSGKTTIAKELHKILAHSRIFCQDDYYLPVGDPRHIWIPEVNHFNWDIVSSLDMERMTRDISEHLKESSQSPTETPKLQDAQAICYESEKRANLLKINEHPCHIVIVEGFCIFNYEPLVDLCDLKYYFTLDFDECLKRRIQRVYEPPDVPGYFEKCVWPEHLKQLAEIKQNVSDVVYFNGNSSNQLELILKDIVKLL